MAYIMKNVFNMKIKVQINFNKIFLQFLHCIIFITHDLYKQASQFNLQPPGQLIHTPPHPPTTDPGYLIPLASFATKTVRTWYIVSCEKTVSPSPIILLEKTLKKM